VDRTPVADVCGMGDAAVTNSVIRDAYEINDLEVKA
jgi:hypothetical protein